MPPSEWRGKVEPMTTRQALLLARPNRLRASRLFDDGTRLVSADLHNHSLFSDGRGRAEDAFAAMRAAGLDVAALTDHAKIGYDFFSRFDPCTALGSSFPCRGVIGLNEAGWRRTGALADAADDPGAFTAIRGFEWTHPTLGHVNVWLTERWIDALHTSGSAGTASATRRTACPASVPCWTGCCAGCPATPGWGPSTTGWRPSRG
jgi:hypothetical protein